MTYLNVINCLDQGIIQLEEVQRPLVSSKCKKKTCEVSLSNLLFIVAMDSIERMLQVKFFLIHAGHTSLGSLWNITIVRGNGMKDLHNRVSKCWEK